MDDTSPDTALEASFKAPRSRRTFLKGALATGVAAAGVGLLTESASAQSADTIQTIFNVAATAETLAVTFYTNGVNNATALGLSGNDLDEIKAALLEEEIHLEFFVANGGVPAAQTFSFPKGPATFTDLSTFISTQQQLEGVFDSAFIAASYEFGQMNRPDLTRYACMIAMIESEHRALGRDIARSNNVTLDASMAGTSTTDPADNWAFAPQTIPSVGAAPGIVQAAGYLSPSGTNSFTYQKPDVTSGTYSAVYGEIMFKAPSVAM
jgi:Ferritin-like domain/TAT (twin-arginine translocation) pathway signal sequence